MKLVNLREASDKNLDKVKKLFKSYDGRTFGHTYGDFVEYKSFKRGICLVLSISYRGAIERYTYIEYYPRYDKTRISVEGGDDDFTDTITQNIGRAEKKIKSKTGAKFDWVDMLGGLWLDGIPNEETVKVCSEVLLKDFEYYN